MKTSKFKLLALLALGLNTGCAIADPVSSHTPKYYNEIQAGRVMVAHMPEFTAAPNLVMGVFRAEDGTYQLCGFKRTSSGGVGLRVEHGKWRAFQDAKYGALVEYDDSEAKAVTVAFTFYPKAGNIVEHAWSRYYGSWFISRTGHIQDSWPRFLKDRCPSLKLPADLPINENQTSDNYQELLQQDPGAVIRFPDQPTPPDPFSEEAKRKWQMSLNQAIPMTEASYENVRELAAASTGRMIDDGENGLFVPVVIGDQAQVWRIDANDKKTILDYAILDNTDKNQVVLNWQKSGLEPTVMSLAQARDWLLLAKGHKHPAIRTTDQMVANGMDVTFNDQSKLVFAKDGILKGEEVSSGYPVEGRWWFDGERICAAGVSAEPPKCGHWQVIYDTVFKG